MEFLKKSIASFALLAMGLFVAQPSVSAANLGFSDDAEIPSWAEEAIDELMNQGVLNGNADGSFAPNRQLNRAEVAKIIVLATGIASDTTGGPNFPDVNEGDWFYNSVETMYNYGWINGYPDGMFRPGVGINRAELAKMVVNSFGIDKDLAGGPHFDDVNSGDWFYGYVETAYNNGLMRGYGDGTFGPSNPVTRAETARIVYDSQLVVSEPTGPSEGTLEVMLSNDTPRGTNIPYNATSVPFTTVELTASDDSDVEISSLTFTRLGLGDNDDFDNVWVEIDGFKVGNDKSVNNDDLVELRFNPPVVVPAGQTIVADIVSSMKYSLNADGTCFGSGTEGCNIGHHNRFALVIADDVVSTASNVVGDFPIEGEEMEIADYQVSQIEFTELGNDTTVNVGDSFVEVGKFRMLNESTTNKDVEVRAITFKNDGTAELEDTLENAALYVSGEQVSAETIMDGDYITFRLDNGVTGGYVIEDGDSRIFSIRTDIVSAEKDDTIKFKIDNFEDVVGVEIGTSFGVKAVDENNDNAEDSNATLATYTVDSGDLNVSRDPSSLGNQEYAPGSNDVVFLTARVVADQPIILDGVKVMVSDASNSKTATLLDDMTELNASFDNFRLYLDDKLIDSENDFSGTFGTNGSGAYLDFNTTFEVAGTSILKLVGNVQDKAATGSQLKLKVAGTNFDSPEYISTGDQVTSDELLGSAEASYVQVEQSALTVTRTDGLGSSEKIVAGVDDVTFMEFVLDNNDSGDVNVTSVSLGSIGTGAAATYSNFTVALFVDDVQQGSARNLATDGTATFNDVNIVVPSAGQKEVVVVVDTIESVATSSAVVTKVANGAGTTTATGVAICSNAKSVNSTPSVSCFAADGTTPAGITADVKAGDTLVIDGDNIIVSADASAGATSISVTATTVDKDSSTATGDTLSTVVSSYGNTGSITLVDASALKEGDIIRITGANGGVATAPYTAEDFAIKTISGKVVTLARNDDKTTADTLGTNPIAVGVNVTQQNADSTIRFFVTGIDADNAENGDEVVVTENSVTLNGVVSGSEGATKDNDCDTTLNETDSKNYLCGVKFDIVSSGTLTVDDVALVNVASDILIAGDENVEIYKMKLSAANDEIQVTDLHFINDTNLDGTAEDYDRVDFKLYNEAGQMVQEKAMSNGELHFELANSDRIVVPANGSTTVTVKVDVRSITSGDQTGQKLVLDLNRAATGSQNGVEAVTAATGNNLESTAVSNSEDNSNTFVAYRTSIEFASVAAPTFQASASESSVYRFTVSSDEAYDAILNSVAVQISSSAADVLDNAAAQNFKLVRYPTSAYTGNPTDIATVAVAAGAAGAYDQTVSFSGFEDDVESMNYYEVRIVGGYNNGASDNDSISGVIVNNATDVDVDTAVAGVETANGSGTASSIIWSDRSNSGSAGSYINGFEIVYDRNATAMKE